MNGNKGPYIVMFIACLLVFTGLYSGWSLAATLRDMEGTAPAGKVSVTAKDRPGSAGYGFSEDEIDKITRSLGVGSIAYSSQSELTAGFESKAAGSRVIGTNSQYRMFCKLDIVSGSFFSEADEREGSPVAVIDEKLAWQLFNNDRVVGCFINIAGRKFKITGVAAHDGSVIGKLAEDGVYNIYMPFGALLELKNDALIDHFIVSTGTSGIAAGNTERVRDSLLALRKDPGNYNIIDCDLRDTVNDQKYRLVIFVMGMVIIIVILGYTVKRIKQLVKNILSDCRTDYLSGVLRLHRKNLIASLVMLLMAAAGTGLIWQLIRFKVYIPAQLIPDDLTDLTYYSRQLQDLIARNVSNLGYRASYDEITRNSAQALLNWSLYPGIIAGLTLFYSGLAGFGKREIPLTSTMLSCGIFLAACTALDALVFKLSGLSIDMDLKALIILWAFFLINILVFDQHKRDEGRQDEIRLYT